MHTLSGRSCLLFDEEITVPAPALLQRAHGPRYASAAIPGDDLERARLAAQIGRPAVFCARCGVSISEGFTRRAKSGTAYCQPCADLTVAAFYARHPERRPSAESPRRERTGTAYVKERERYSVRYHAGNGFWQIADTQTRRWTAQRHATQQAALEAAEDLNLGWRLQLASENEDDKEQE